MERFGNQDKHKDHDRFKEPDKNWIHKEKGHVEDSHRHVNNRNDDELDFNVAIDDYDFVEEPQNKADDFIMSPKMDAISPFHQLLGAPGPANKITQNKTGAASNPKNDWPEDNPLVTDQILNLLKKTIQNPACSLPLF